MPKGQRLSFEDLKTEMEDSFYGSKSSPEFENVVQALRHVSALYDAKISTQSAVQMFKAQKELQDSCKVYLEGHKRAWSSKGSQRIDLVSQLSDMASAEKFDAYRDPDVLKEKISGAAAPLRWRDAVSEERTKKLDATKAPLEKAGANSSTRIVVDGYFFTESEKLPETKILTEQFAGIDRVYDKLSDAQKAVMDKDTFRDLANSVPDEPSYAKMAGAAKDMGARTEAVFKQHGKEFLYDALIDAHRTDTMLSNAASAAIPGEVDITKHNVASSRMAGLFGESRLIAKSHTAELITPDGVKKGVAMERAQGLDAAAKGAKLQPFTEVDFTALNNPGFKKDLMTLELMDRITGQVDRHGANMFYQLDAAATGNPPKRQIRGIQGIDNDLAFGTHVQIDKTGGRTPGFFDDIKHIDAGAYDNLMKLNKDVVDYAFGDVLSQPQRDALTARVREAQKTIQDKVMSGEVKIVRSEKEWADVQIDPNNPYLLSVKGAVQKAQENYKTYEDKLEADRHFQKTEQTIQERTGNVKIGLGRRDPLKVYPSDKAERGKIVIGKDRKSPEARPTSAQQLKGIKALEDDGKETPKAKTGKPLSKTPGKRPLPQTPDKKVLPSTSNAHRPLPPIPTRGKGM